MAGLFFAMISSYMGLIAIMLPIVILAILGIVNLVSYNKKKPYEADMVETILLWIPILNSVLIVIICFILFV